MCKKSSSTPKPNLAEIVRMDHCYSITPWITGHHTMKNILKFLEIKHLLSENAFNHLKKTYSEMREPMMTLYLRGFKDGIASYDKCPKPLQNFAATLHFYSRTAYDLVRKEFEVLPDHSTVRKWYTHVDCRPGFIAPAFKALEIKAEEAEVKKRKLVCSLMFGEIPLKKQIDFDGKETWGYVDHGIEVTDDELELATEALVFMVVSHQFHWKLPIGYFFINELTPEERANLVKESLTRLSEVNVLVTSLTCNGPSLHYEMLKTLGCNFDYHKNMQSHFPHPVHQDMKVYAILDISHMFRLARIALASLGSFKNSDGNTVSWEYIKQLDLLQKSKDLLVGNKLGGDHKKVMKVHLADVQTLSSNVADAIEICAKEFGLAQFQGSKATVEFIRLLNDLFDIMNSKSVCGKGPKAPLKKENRDNWKFLLNAVGYLMRCTDMQDMPLHMSPRKTPFLGFAVSAWSFCGIFDTFLTNKTRQLKYLITHKCSLDHLEAFSASMIFHNGGKNPTCLQFRNLFKQLLLTTVNGKNVICKPMETTTVLTIPSTHTHNETVVDVSLCRKYGIDMDSLQTSDYDYDILPINLDIIQENVARYVAGYVVKMLEKTLKCVECLLGCMLTKYENVDGPSKLRGQAVVPTHGVIKICDSVETVIRKIIAHTDRVPKKKKFFRALVNMLSQRYYAQTNFFPNDMEHFQEMSLLDGNHYFLLIKNIVNNYVRIRFFNIGKTYGSKISGSLCPPAVE